MTRSPRPVAGEHGALSLEMAILAPVLLLVFGLMALAGRVYLAGSTVANAARDAARAASLQNSPGGARQAALQVATQSLTSQGIHCVNTDVTVPTAGFTAPLGQPAAVTVTVTCQVQLAGLFPGVPGTKTLRGSFTCSIDQYRQRATAPMPLTRETLGVRVA
ncbi:TadE/TadG family type IV pilus assembly protein [Streptacidiphilus anmyonensis]|uniref:TadE/TadG family type IV pilus assembly protein n=1 Tax=Streptacidiphilus anmyonensis TaxID=405782 RepID=UPI0005A8BB44|nr:TadE/TadG family type IV pilus assembly protein [Streptacidiphilus anmyonensis]